MLCCRLKRKDRVSLDAIGIISKDIPAAVKFYGLLGVELNACGGPDHFEGSTPGGVRIMVDSVELIKKLHPGWQDPSGSGVVLCFKQESPAHVDALFTRILEGGFKSVKEPWDAFWGQRYASVRDPDGNQVDLFAPLSA